MRRRAAIAIAGSGLVLAVAVLSRGWGGSVDRIGAGAPNEPAPASYRGTRALRAQAGALRPALAPLRPDAEVDDAARRRELAQASPVARALATYSADELALLADFERLTGREAPAELLALLERRRARATPEELKAAARHLFAGDPLGRAAALGWLRTHGSER